MIILYTVANTGFAILVLINTAPGPDVACNASFITTLLNAQNNALMNEFGGNWTNIKIEILVKYAKAFLTIMAKRQYFKLLYFDGFAGSGFIIKGKKENVELTVGAARRIIEISEPKPFDSYYFVEKETKNYKLLLENTKLAYPTKQIFTVQEDCNKKMLDLAAFLHDPKHTIYRTLAYIDPCGMQVEWKSIQAMKDLPIDMWILVPTGMGVNRLLKKNFQITEEWYSKLQTFLGLSRQEIDEYFYQTKKTSTLFGDEEFTTKETNAIQKSAKLYQKRLKEVFNYVSSPYELKNSTKSIMYHLFLAANNRTAVKIANDIVKTYNK